MIMGPTHEGLSLGGPWWQVYWISSLSKKGNYTDMNPQDRKLTYDEQISDERLKSPISSL